VPQPREIGAGALLWGPGLGGTWPRTCLVGPDWPCAVVTISLIVGISAAWIVYVAETAGALFAAVGVLSTLLTLLCFCKTAFSDPGIQAKQPVLVVDESSANIVCPHCNVYRARGTFHCLMCNACVERLDHHCPWTGKCIGRRTIRYFRAFLGMLSLHIVFVIISIGVRFIESADASLGT